MFNYQDYETQTLYGMRFYNTPVGLLPSITTVLSKSATKEKVNALQEWRDGVGHTKAAQITKDAQDNGTNVHLMCERYFQGKNPLENIDGVPIPPEHIKFFNGLKFKLRQVKEVWGQEQSVYSDALGVAGRFDVVGVYKGFEAIMDFKTAARIKSKQDIEDYYLQLAFYADAHNTLFGTNIQKGVILMTANSIPQEFIFDTKPYISELQARIDTFWIQVADVLV